MWQMLLYLILLLLLLAQLLFNVIEKLGYKNLINKDIAECLYAGIMTDTGSFKFSSTTAETHKIIAQLIDFGA